MTGWLSAILRDERGQMANDRAFWYVALVLLAVGVAIQIL